jgi:hypothetical protein
MGISACGTACTKPDDSNKSKFKKKYKNKKGMRRNTETNKAADDEDEMAMPGPLRKSRGSLKSPNKS